MHKNMKTLNITQKWNKKKSSFFNVDNEPLRSIAEPRRIPVFDWLSLISRRNFYKNEQLAFLNITQKCLSSVGASPSLEERPQFSSLAAASTAKVKCCERTLITQEPDEHFNILNNSELLSSRRQLKHEDDTVLVVVKWVNQTDAVNVRGLVSSKFSILNK